MLFIGVRPFSCCGDRAAREPGLSPSTASTCAQDPRPSRRIVGFINIIRERKREFSSNFFIIIMLAPINSGC